MLSDALTLNSLWARLMIEEFIRHGCSFFCLSPGSRSTPLILAVAEHRQATSQICYDERAAAYYALGYARATGQPCVLIATSGTAATNYLPAIVEASNDHVPLIVLTADRPPELRHTGANQTIDQVKLYGDYVRFFFDLPAPDPNVPPEAVLTTVDQAVFRSRHPVPGPVHLNCMYREPLAPLQAETFSRETYLRSVQHWEKDARPFTTYATPDNKVPPSELQHLVSELKSVKKGLLVVGQLPPASPKTKKPVLQLARKLKWPLVTDIASQLRLEADIPFHLPYFDYLLLSDEVRQRIVPEWIVFIGQRLVSKWFWRWLADHPEIHLLKISPYPERSDPEHRINQQLCADPASFCETLAPALPPQQPSDYFLSLQRLSEIVADYFRKYVEGPEALSEPGLARCLSYQLPPQSGLFLANSMPIRDMDMFGATGGCEVRVAVNRGASGIDGNLATACGFARGLGRLTTAVLGDLALIHDLNSLLLLKSSPVPVILIVVNNQGGGIFSMLPVRAVEPYFEPFFGTPHSLTFTPLAQSLDIPCVRVNTIPEFKKAYHHASTQERSFMIEVVTDREENRRIHEKIQQELIALLRPSS